MEKCQKKDRLYNAVTRRCYKSCEQKQKDTHPVTKKCRKRCKSEKIRRAEDFRCVKKTLNLKKNTRKLYKKKSMKTKAQLTKAKETKVLGESKDIDFNEELVPPPLQKEIQKNFQFLDYLLQKGKEKTVSYFGSRMVSDFITVYFHEKYKQHCPMYPIKTYSNFKTEKYKKTYKKYEKNFTETKFKEQLLKQNKAYYIDWNQEKFLKNLKLCLETGEHLIMMPLRIECHLNMLILKVPTREIIRFEPNGVKNADEGKYKETNIFLEKLTADINAYLDLNTNRKFTYVDPSKICPNYNSNLSRYKYPGFQTMEVRNKKAERLEGSGFCQLWSWFFAECVIQNPDMDVKEVYKEAFNALKTNENGFATIIRGYFFSINDELKKMKKSYTIEKSITSTIGANDILLDYLRQSQWHLQSKPRKTFQNGGIKKHKFILPKANPKATPVYF